MVRKIEEVPAALGCYESINCHRASHRILNIGRDAVNFCMRPTASGNEFAGGGRRLGGCAYKSQSKEESELHGAVGYFDRH